MNQEYPLTPLQEGMLYHAVSHPQSGIDIEQIIITLREALNESVWHQAWELIVEQEPHLRTALRWANGERPTHIVAEKVQLPLAINDWSNLSAEAQDARLQKLLHQDRLIDFDLSVAPLMRLTVCKLAPEKSYCIWTFHHILLDGRSFPLILEDVFDAYDVIRGGKEERGKGKGRRGSFAEFVAWREQQEFEGSRGYWRALLADFFAPTSLDFGLGNGEGFGWEEVRLSAESTNHLTQFSQEQNVTLNTVLQAAWSLLLHHYSGEKDVVFGNTRACRHNTIENANDVLGLFINTLPVRSKISVTDSLHEVLGRLREQHIAVRQHEQTPLPLIQKWSDVEAGQPLFESLVVFENYLLDTRMKSLGGKWLERDFLYRGQTNFPLALIAYADERMVLRLEYERSRFAEAVIRPMLHHLTTLLTNFTDPDALALSIPYLTPDEQHQLLHQWNPTTPIQHTPATLHQRFEAQVAATPDAIAVTFEGESLTYDQLNRRSNQLAHHLIGLGVRREALVGLCVARSADIVIGILGILKAGAAYVPLDPDTPAERLAHIIDDANISILVTHNQVTLPPLATEPRTIISLDAIASRASQENPNKPVSPTNLAYVIYTSGSTGKPKGALITHANVTRLFDSTDHWFNFGTDDVWTLFHSFAFDFSVWELWGALLYGGRVVVVPYWVSRSPQQFWQLLIDEGVTILNQTPSAFRQLIPYAVNRIPNTEYRIRVVIFGGEALDLAMLKPWVEDFGDERPRLVNMYGITETTVHVTYRPITRTDIATNQGSLIGEPIPDLQLYILNEQPHPVPIGVTGEMYVGGAGVARGYLRRPHLTAQRFTRIPYTEHRIPYTVYRTGDLARRLPNGDIEFIGRADQQVKIRGFRIELGEIEAVLRNHKAIRDVIVTVKKEAETIHLVAYYIPFGAVSEESLRKHCSTQLPSYMVPAFFVSLDAFPLTSNGKLNRRALPVPGKRSPTFGKSWTSSTPRTEAEKAIAESWQVVLKLDRVSVNDNFFALGGDSILSIQIIGRLRNAGWHITPQQIFQHPTIADLATVATRTEQTNSVQSMARGRVPLTPIQHWFFEQDFPDLHHWNQAFLFEVTCPELVEGRPPTNLAGAIVQLLRHHDALRLRFGTDNGQRYATPDDIVPLEVIDLRGVENWQEEIERISAETQTQLNIHTGPLIRFIYFQAETDHLFIAIHHLAVDGVSWRILLEDLSRLIDGAELPPKTTSFQQWSQSLQRYATSDKLQREVAFWRELNIERLLPTDFEGANTEASVQMVTTTLDRDATDALLRRVPTAYNTQINDVLLTALAQTIAEVNDSQRVLFDLEGHGREMIASGLDLSRTVGWFTSIFPVSLRVEVAHIGRLLMSIKEQLRRVPQRGIGYGILRYLGEQLPSLQPSIAFNYLGQFDQSVAEVPHFTFSDIPFGATHSPTATRRHTLEIIAQIREGKLRVAWHFSTNLHQRATIERLAHTFQSNLNALIEHCLNVQQTRFTPSDFPLATVTQATLDKLLAKQHAIEDIYPLSPIQQLFYAADSANPALGFEQWHFKLTGNLNTCLLRRAWQRVIDRHPILRTAFISDGLDQPHQIVYQDVSLAWGDYDWRDVSAFDQRLQAFLQRDRETPFRLTQPPLSRVAVIHADEVTTHLIWSTHHLEIDGWSWPLVFQDLAHQYELLTGARDDKHSKRAPTYRRYIEWLQAQTFEQNAPFWREHLRGLSKPTALAGKRRQSGDDTQFAEIGGKISAETATNLHQFAQTNHITLGTLVQAAWAILLSAANHSDDVLFGTTFAGRPPAIPQVEQIVGAFVNNLPVRVHIDATQSLSNFLQTCQAQQAQLAAYQHTPLTHIQQWSEIPLRERLFESLVVFQNYAIGDETAQWADGVVLETVSDPTTTNYPLTLVVVPHGEWRVEIGYHRAWFSAAIAQSILKDFTTLLHLLSDNANKPIAQLQQQLTAWRTTAAQQPRNGHKPAKRKPLHQPQSHIERTIADLWERAFASENISLYDNFFDLGGHSLMIVNIHSELEQALGRQFPITKTFQYPTIASLAKYLSQDERDNGNQKTQSRAERIRAARNRKRKT